MKTRLSLAVCGLILFLSVGCTTYYHDGYGYSHTHYVPVFDVHHYGVYDWYHCY